MATPLDWARLLRLPNHATAAADVLAGWLVVSGVRDLGWPPTPVGLAIGAGLALYAAGMVLNDVYDVDLDRQERPDRPLPSGRIALGTAAVVGQGLLLLGGLLGCAAAILSGHPAVLLVTAVLTAAVWLYDRWAKATPWGPAVMGLCRSLNWLIGMTVAGGPTEGHQWLIPIGMGLYVGGITLYARDEAGNSRAATLLSGALAMAVGLALVAAQSVETVRSGEAAPFLANRSPGNWAAVWAVLITLLSLRNLLPVIEPSPGRVQATVGNAIMAIITIDAIIVMGRCGETWGIALLLLLAPFAIGRRLVPPT
jgi:4-hydroxybenzoate polyprenyltransferase